MSDRRYTHQGYRSSGEPERPAPRDSTPRPAAPPADRGDRPRGRGMGAPTAEVFRCARCGVAEPVAVAAGLEARCSGCGNDLHTCTNCSHFDTGSRFECRREIAARVSPKDRANRCELFEPRLRHEFAQEKRVGPSDARSAFDALFKS